MKDQTGSCFLAMTARAAILLCVALSLRCAAQSDSRQTRERELEKCSSCRAETRKDYESESKESYHLLKRRTIVFNSTRALDGSDAENTGGNDNLWVIRVDGSGAAPLTRLTAANGGNNFFDFAWSPKGSSIASDSTRALDGSDAPNPNITSNVWVMRANGSAARALTKLTAIGSRSLFLAWSPNGRKIAFDSGRALDGSDAGNLNLTRNIWVVKAHGHGSVAIPLTKLTAWGTDCTAPAWSPDGRKIIFGSARVLDGSDVANFVSNIWVMNADGSGATPLTKLTAVGAGSSTPAAWSPDGSKIVFVSLRALDGSDATNTNLTENIWVMNADGSGAVPLTKLTAAGVSTSNIVLSPDGSQIAFESSRALDGSDAGNTNGTKNIWVMNADGSGVTPLTKLTASGAYNIDPAWSPDGSQIAFDSPRALDGSDATNPNSTVNIWVLNADGSGVTPVTKLTAVGAHSLQPQWRP